MADTGFIPQGMSWLPEGMTWEEAIAQSDERYGKCNYGVIYRVWCEETGVSYVGQTTADLSPTSSRARRKTMQPPRVLNHYNALKKGIHPHQELQNSWNTSSGTFRDEPLEIVNVNDFKSGKRILDEREKHWQAVFGATEAKPKSEQLHYRLSADTLRQLKQVGAINNQALVFFILKLQNPWCDRPLKVEPLRIAVEWDLPESSVYEAILKLKQQGLIEITQSTMTLQWVNPKPVHSQPQSPQSKLTPKPDTPKPNWDARTNSEMSEQDLGCQNGFWDVRTDSGMSENQPSEPAPNKASSASQTLFIPFTDFIQTLSDSERADFKDFCRKETDNYPRPIINLGDYLASKDSNGQPRYLDFWERFRAGAAPRTGAADGEQAWKEALGYAARYNRYDEATWLKSLPISPEMKSAIGACGGLMRLGEANSSELFALKQTFKQAFSQPINQPIKQEAAYAMPAMR